MFNKNNKKNDKKNEYINKKKNNNLNTTNPINQTLKHKIMNLNRIIKNFNAPKLNRTQVKVNKKSEFEIPKFKSKSTTKRNPKLHQINSEPIDRKSQRKIKPNHFLDILEIDAIKSKFKKKLIEGNDKILGPIHYYNGPIDMSCISCKNYEKTVENLIKRVRKNGFQCTQHLNYYYKFTNGLNSYFVEIVKIRNNMLYYLVVKD